MGIADRSSLEPTLKKATKELHRIAASCSGIDGGLRKYLRLRERERIGKIWRTGCGSESVLYVQLVRDEKRRNTQPRTHTEMYVSIQARIDTDKSVSTMDEHNESPKDVQSSLGAHWSDLLKMHNTMALCQRH